MQVVDIDGTLYLMGGDREVLSPVRKTMMFGLQIFQYRGQTLITPFGFTTPAKPVATG